MATQSSPQSSDEDIDDLKDLLQFRTDASVLIVQQKALGDQFDFTEHIDKLRKAWAEIEERLDRKQRAKMTALAITFPAITRDTPGVAPFAPEILDEWAATTPRLRQKTLVSVRFILSAWSSTKQWKVGPFSLIDFYHHSDHRHWKALGLFCKNPFMVNK